MAAIKFSKQYIKPNPSEVDYWVDLSSDVTGGNIKYHNGTDWVDFINSNGATVSLGNYYNKNEISALLSKKASYDEVNGKVDDNEIAEVIKDIKLTNKGEYGIELLLLKYDNTTVGVTLPVASSVETGVITPQTFKDLVKQNQLQKLYSEIYDKLAEIRSQYQPRLKAGDNIVIDHATNTIHVKGELAAGWDQITNRPDFKTVATTGDYNDLINRPDQTISNISSKLNNEISRATLAEQNIKNAYLPLSGGTLNGSTAYTLTINRSSDAPLLAFKQDGVLCGFLGVNNLNQPLFFDNNGVLKYLIHSGNTDAYNSGSATKLQTARTIWGQSFDGTGDVSGNLTLGNTEAILVNNASGESSTALEMSSSNNLLIGRGTSYSHYNTHLYGLSIHLRYGTALTDGFVLNRYGNVTIGPNDLASTKYRLYVNGSILVAGNILATGSITQESQRDLKDIIDEKVLSLDDMSVIKPTRFKWKDGRDDEVHYGGIAEDIQQVIPEVVHKPGDNLTVEYGNAAFVMVASLVEHVKALTERVSFLENECEQLRKAIA